MRQRKIKTRNQTLNQILTPVEQDFIEFMSKKRTRPIGEIRNIYLTTREDFGFGTPGYRELVDSIHRLNKVRYDDSDEQEVIQSYRFHELIHLFRFLSYSSRSPAPSFVSNLAATIALIKQGNFSELANGLLQKLRISADDRSLGRRGYTVTAAHLLKLVEQNPVVVDYGCGLGYLLFELAKRQRKAQIYLVDIDSLILEFARFRFEKQGIPVQLIPISEDNLYPDLPIHEICIATEVLEHVFDPLKVFSNIRKRLTHGGIWYGDFEDRRREMFHVSADLRAVRAESQKYFKKISAGIYRKVA